MRFLNESRPFLGNELMINIRSTEELRKIRAVCSIAAEAMEVAYKAVRPGVMTIEISDIVRRFIESRGAKAAFYGYGGFPGDICVSVNEEIVHGIPKKRMLHEGDIVKVDIGTYKDGFYGDVARSFPVGVVGEKAKHLIESTEQALYHGLAKAVAGNKIGDIGNAVQTFVEERGYSVVRALVGHGIGRHLHEEPQIPNYGKAGKGPLLKSGMVLAVEPMVNVGTWEINVLDDNWTAVTADGELSAHFENTCIIRDGFPEIVTLMKGEEPWQKTIQ